MKRIMLGVFVLILLSSSSVPVYFDREREIQNFINFYESMDVYRKVEFLTGVSADILRGISITESNEKDSAIGDDGISVGRMQINEKWRKDRVKRYGDYDPKDPFQSVLLSAYLFKDNMKVLGSEDLAIAAHRQGVAGVLKYGPSYWYINRVRENSRRGL